MALLSSMKFRPEFIHNIFDVTLHVLSHRAFLHFCFWHYTTVLVSRTFTS